MNLIFFSFVVIFLCYFFLNLFTKKFNILESKFHNNHQTLVGKESIPLTGGLIFFLYMLCNYGTLNNNIIIFSLFILILGILSDINYLNSPIKRLIFQLLVIFSFLYFYEFRINDLRIKLFEEFFFNNYFKFLITGICILILINGSNFIDGLNGLNLGYYFLVLLVTQYLIYSNMINVENDSVLICLIGISFLLTLNFFNFLYLGDSGAYLVSFVAGGILIYIHHNNSSISPYFIALLLWYPAFENFFSIIRKKLNKINPVNPDTNHLHQLIFKFFGQKNFRFRKYANQISSLSILSYNLIIFLISINHFRNTKFMLFLILVNVLVYLIIFILLFKRYRYNLNYKN